MWNQEITPRFPAAFGGVLGGVQAPFDGRVFLRLNHAIGHLTGRFRFKKIDAIVGLGDEVRDVFRLICAVFLENLKLTAGGFEPLLRFSIENQSQFALSI